MGARACVNFAALAGCRGLLRRRHVTSVEIDCGVEIDRNLGRNVVSAASACRLPRAAASRWILAACQCSWVVSLHFVYAFLGCVARLALLVFLGLVALPALLVLVARLVACVVTVLRPPLGPSFSAL